MSHTTDKALLPVPPYVGNGPYCYTNSLTPTRCSPCWAARHRHQGPSRR